MEQLVQYISSWSLFVSKIQQLAPVERSVHVDRFQQTALERDCYALAFRNGDCSGDAGFRPLAKEVSAFAPTVALFLKILMPDDFQQWAGIQRRRFA